MSESSSVKKYLAELVGTFVLVLMGCGSAVFSSLLGVPLVYALVGISFAFGLAVLVMVYAIGGVSGCHINPAVSISMLAAGKISAKDAVAYVGCSVCGRGCWCRCPLLDCYGKSRVRVGFEWSWAKRLRFCFSQRFFDGGCFCG